MTPETKELSERAKQIMNQAYGRDSRYLFGSELYIKGVFIRYDAGVVAIRVHHGGTEHLVYVETPSGEFVDAPLRGSNPAAVLHGLETLRRHMILDDLAEI